MDGAPASISEPGSRGLAETVALQCTRAGRRQRRAIFGALEERYGGEKLKTLSICWKA
jgi:hypothetical protein